MINLDEIRRLDREKDLHPVRVIRKSRRILARDRIPGHLIPRLLGVCGSAYARRGWTARATEALDVGLELARTRSNFSAEGDLLQRLHLVCRDQGDYSGALVATAQARTAHLLGDELSAVGKTFVHDAGAYYYLNDFELCLRSACTALRLLDSAEERYLFTAYSTMARAYLGTGKSTAAKEAFEKAGEFPYDPVRFEWLKAEIHFCAGEYEESSRILAKLQDLLVQRRDGDALLVGLDRLRSEIRLGRGSQAARELQALLPVLASKRWPRTIATAFEAIIANGFRASRVPEELIPTLYADIEKARRYNRRAPNVT